MSRVETVLLAAGVVVSLILGVVGLVRAGRANTHAETAEARADLLERITLERRDVDWSASHGAASLVAVNIGADGAHAVEVAPTGTVAVQLNGLEGQAAGHWHAAADEGYLPRHRL